jgi:hypothetical protein
MPLRARPRDPAHSPRCTRAPAERSRRPVGRPSAHRQTTRSRLRTTPRRRRAGALAAHPRFGLVGPGPWMEYSSGLPVHGLRSSLLRVTKGRERYRKLILWKAIQHAVDVGHGDVRRNADAVRSETVQRRRAAPYVTHLLEYSLDVHARSGTQKPNRRMARAEGVPSSAIGATSKAKQRADIVRELAADVWRPPAMPNEASTRSPLRRRTRRGRS